MNHWWRAYNEAVDDPKLILLSDKAHRAWFNLMCVASANGGILPEIKFIAVKLRITPQQASAIIAELVQAELIDKRDDDRFEPHNWNGRQYKSDVSTDRVKRFRERERNVSVTPPETETETETEKQPSLRSGGALVPEPAKAKRAKARANLPDDWAPDEQDIGYAADRGFDVPAIERMSSGFANHHRSRGNLMADWHAAWRTWTDNEIKFSNSRSPLNQGRTDARGQTGSKIIQAADDICRTIAGFDGPGSGSGGLRGGASPPAPRLLSHR